jgi:ribose 5-phosphate isomerase
MSCLLGVITHNLYISRFALFPFEADSIWVVDTDTVLTLAVSMQRLKSVAGRREQVTQIIGVVEVGQFASSRFLDGQRQFL